MKPYEIDREGDSGILSIYANASHRYKFWQIDSEGNKAPISFKRAGSKLMAAVVGDIAVYKKPNPNEFHREYMRENGLAMYRGLAGCDHDRLVENMLEYVEII